MNNCRNICCVISQCEFNWSREVVSMQSTSSIADVSALQKVDLDSAATPQFSINSPACSKVWHFKPNYSLAFCGICFYQPLSFLCSEQYRQLRYCVGSSAHLSVHHMVLEFSVQFCSYYTKCLDRKTLIRYSCQPCSLFLFHALLHLLWRVPRPGIDCRCTYKHRTQLANSRQH